jgi:hypothetical protein
LNVFTVAVEITERVLDDRSAIVIRAEDEGSRAVENGPEGVRHAGHRIRMCDVVAGDDDQVGVGADELPYP